MIRAKTSSIEYVNVLIGFAALIENTSVAGESRGTGSPARSAYSRVRRSEKPVTSDHSVHRLRKTETRSVSMDSPAVFDVLFLRVLLAASENALTTPRNLTRTRASSSGLNHERGLSEPQSGMMMSLTGILEGSQTAKVVV